MAAHRRKQLDVLAAWVLGIATTIAGNALNTYYQAQQVPDNAAAIKQLSAQMTEVQGSVREIKQWIRDDEYYHRGGQGGDR